MIYTDRNCFLKLLLREKKHYLHFPQIVYIRQLNLKAIQYVDTCFVFGLCNTTFARENKFLVSRTI